MKNSLFLRGLAASFGLFAVLGMVWAGSPSEDDDQPKDWAESEVMLPASSVPGRLIRLDMGPAAENSFAVDRETISVGKDGVVRFMLLVRSPSGAKTVSYEGIRCATKERRSYAYGRDDGQWSRARNDRWSLIEARAINSYAATLYRDFFCPGGRSVRDGDEAVMALEKGGHPSLMQR